MRMRKRRPTWASTLAGDLKFLVSMPEKEIIRVLL